MRGYLKTKVIQMSKDHNVDNLFEKLLEDNDEKMIMKVVVNNREPEKMIKELLDLGDD